LVNLVGRGEPQRLEGAAITADLLTALRVAPLIGRPPSATPTIAKARRASCS
jgi:hypothetical protein